MKFFMIMISNSIITPMMKHPISLGTILMTQTILVCLMMTEVSKNSWFAFILFITIIGGLMIMFMYMSSIASNEMFKPMNLTIMMMITLLIITMIIMNKDETMKMTCKMFNNKTLTLNNEEMKTTLKFYNLNKMNITLIMMMIMLLTMVSVTNISTTFEGPLKKL
uniref:NADH-ubiquinone oxidoreductase chain 6 n=1 Tax=Paracatonidia sp. SX-2018 TaxID=2507540 RepID=A0A565D7D2_9HEMI|nr:NADH dehydrogenase subunit 6 [Paracatonidia sp. SX-2018]